MSDRATWDRAWELFHAALERPPEERAAFLHEKAGSSVELRREVEELLAAHARSERVEEELGAAVAGLLGESEAAEMAGRAIGPYRLVRPLGEGGMGVVWEAEQQAPLARRVALKLIKPGMDSREVLRRFDAERQAMALMEHPGIARVHDAGLTDDGRPYFVMERVDGPPITAWCEEAGLSVEARVRLLLEVCEAVQHAHRKGILHRDLKPSNVLVTLDGDRPIPKVIDFGIAKALGPTAPGQTRLTTLGRLVGTPEYMSPEQAGGGLDVDTRADVYALGALLYELIAGSPPFDFRDTPYPEIQRRLREEEPPRPSTRARTRSAASAPEHSGPSPAAPLRELPAELDWIALKALEKDRERRYGSPAELAADLERHLRHEPVLAGPPSTAYRLRKFVRRHRFGVATAAAFALLLIGFLAMTLLQSRNLARALDTAQRERARSERVSSFLIELFNVADPGESRGDTLTARELLGRGAGQVREELADEPALQAALLDTLGRAHRGVGLHPEARELLEEATELRRQTPGSSEAELADTLVHLAIVQHDVGDYAAAGAALEEALEIRGRLLPADAPEMIDLWIRLGVLRHSEGELAESEEHLRLALATARSRRPEDPDQIAEAQLHLGALRRRQGELEEAGQLLREAAGTFRKTRGADHPDTIKAVDTLAGLFYRAGDLEAAEPLYREVLAARRRVLGEGHVEIANTLNGLGALLQAKGEIAEAERHLREALEIARAATPDPHPRVAMVVNNLAWLLHDNGRYREAEPLYREALEINERILGPDHPSLAINLNNLGLVLFDLGEREAAEPPWDRALEIMRARLGAEHPAIAFTLTNLADLRLDQRQLAAAEALYREALALRRRTLPEGHRDLAATLTGLGRLLTAMGELAEAEALLREAVGIRRASQPPGHWQIALAESLLGGCLVRAGRFEEAEPLLVAGPEAIAARRGPGDARSIRALERLVELYERSGRSAEAAEARTRLAAARAASS